MASGLRHVCVRAAFAPRCKVRFGRGSAQRRGHLPLDDDRAAGEVSARGRAAPHLQFPTLHARVDDVRLRHHGDQPRILQQPSTSLSSPHLNDDTPSHTHTHHRTRTAHTTHTPRIPHTSLSSHWVLFCRTTDSTRAASIG